MKFFLAVGDAQFQKNAGPQKWRSYQCGRTVLFVSHNMEAVQNLCSRAVLLSEGKIYWLDDSPEIGRCALSFKCFRPYIRASMGISSEAPGNDSFVLLALPSSPITLTILWSSTVCTPLTFCLSIEFYKLTPCYT